MYQHQLHQKIAKCAKREDFPEEDAGILFLPGFIANAAAIKALYDELYASTLTGESALIGCWRPSPGPSLSGRKP